MNLTRPWFSILLLLALLCLVALALLGFQSHDQPSYFEERVKLALRDAGNQMLLSNNDSTSLVKPVLMLSDLRYELSFESDLYIEPTTLVQHIKQSIATANLPENYITEVRDCATRDVAYSFQNSYDAVNQIVPCAGRELPLNCYTIQVLFTKDTDHFIAYHHYPLYSLLLVGFIGVGLVYRHQRKPVGAAADDLPFVAIGGFKFYPELQELRLDDSTIALTTKECELLAIFGAQPNTIIKREHLTKTVWEDQGVFVGRSLDTYISKLRKKLSKDPSLSLVNVHGVGYKLEVD